MLSMQKQIALATELALNWYKISEKSDDQKYLPYHILAITRYMPGLNYGGTMDSCYDRCADI